MRTKAASRLHRLPRAPNHLCKPRQSTGRAMPHVARGEDNAKRDATRRDPAEPVDLQRVAIGAQSAHQHAVPGGPGNSAACGG